MRGTEILTNEHRIIEQVLDCLQAMADQVKSGVPTKFRSVRQALNFFEHFAEGHHHLREELYLVPLVEQHDLNHPAVAAHSDENAKHLRALAKAVDRAEQGDGEGIERFVYHATAYGRLLRERMGREEKRLFPLVNHFLTEEEQKELAVALSAWDMEREKYLDIADDLAMRYNVPCLTHSDVENPGCFQCNRP